nr:hypothetical protein [Tanacetum cinerariifolium]
MVKPGENISYHACKWLGKSCKAWNKHEKGDNIAVLDGTYGMATDYGITNEEMSKLSGRKSVPRMNSRNKGKWKEKTTRSSRERIRDSR